METFLAPLGRHNQKGKEMKRPMIVVLAMVSTALVLPAFASALPAHLNSTSEFALHGGSSVLTRASSGAPALATGTTITGTGEFDTTTTGTLRLTFHHVTGALPTACTTSGQPTGTVTTTELPFHLVMLETEAPGMLITPGVEGHFVDYSCGIFNPTVEWRGNGILGTLTDPECGHLSNTASINFKGSEGTQEHQNYTETTYTLESRINGAETLQSALDAMVSLTFAEDASPQLICTHW